MSKDINKIILDRVEIFKKAMGECGELVVVEAKLLQRRQLPKRLRQRGELVVGDVQPFQPNQFPQFLRQRHAEGRAGPGHPDPDRDDPAADATEACCGRRTHLRRASGGLEQESTGNDRRCQLLPTPGVVRR